MCSASAGQLPVEEVNRLWDRIKQDEREERRAARAAAGIVVEEPGFLGGIAEALPALTRAQKLTARAAKVGFDWPETGQVVAKIHEELDEVREAAEANDPDRLEDEIGDLLFAVTNLARHHGVDPEEALRRTNAKFERRFKAIEDGLARAGSSLDSGEPRRDGTALGRGEGAGSRRPQAVTRPRLRETAEKPRLLSGRDPDRQDRMAVLVLARSRISVFSCSQAKPRPSSGATSISKLDLSAARWSEIASRSAGIPSPVSAEISTGRLSPSTRRRAPVEAPVLVRVEEIGLVPDLDDPSRVVRIDPELAQHAADVARLRLGLVVRDVADMQQDVGLDRRPPASPGRPRPAWSAGRR